MNKKKAVKKEENVDEKANVKEKKEEEILPSLEDRSMNAVLLEFRKTVYWTAVKMFLDDQYVKVRNSLLIIDPKESTYIARQQGLVNGTILLETYLNQIKKNKDDKEKDEAPGVSY